MNPHFGRSAWVLLSFLYLLGCTVAANRIDPGNTVRIGYPDYTAVVSGLEDVHEHTVVVGAEDQWLPAYLSRRSDRERWKPNGNSVEILRVRFVTTEVASLRITVQRTGDETLVMKLGEHQTVFPAAESESAGGVKLNAVWVASAINPGKHNLELSIAEDGLGNGFFYLIWIEISAE